jgi:histidinol phosphatase-like enzyme
MDWVVVNDRESLSTGKAGQGGVLYKTLAPPSSETAPVILVDFDGTVFMMAGPKFAGCPANPIEPIIEALAGVAERNMADVFIISNQKWRVPISEIQARLDDGARQLVAAGIPLCGIYASLGDDWYRKPLPGMAELALAGRTPSRLLMIGDAAGRSGDLSCCDRQLAYNVRARFLTPEELIQPQAHSQFDWGAIAPALIERMLVRRGGRPWCNPPSGPPGSRELVVLCGYPGSGKTSLAKALEVRGYYRVSGDETRGKILVALGRIPLETSIVVDRIHHDPGARALYIPFARARDLRVRCVYVDAGIHWAYHKMRARALWGDKAMTAGGPIPTLVYRRFRMVPPTLEEGFDCVEIVGGEVDLDTCGETFARMVRLLQDVSKV